MFSLPAAEGSRLVEAADVEPGVLVKVISVARVGTGGVLCGEPGGGEDALVNMCGPGRARDWAHTRHRTSLYHQCLAKPTVPPAREGSAGERRQGFEREASLTPTLTRCPVC